MAFATIQLLNPIFIKLEKLGTFEPGSWFDDIQFDSIWEGKEYENCCDE